jgi:hypothetical protein
MATTDFSNYDPEIPLYCANHPNEQTYLRCGKCEKPICSRCRVSTPVGFRCYQCANLSVLPTYAVSTDYYLKSSIAGLLAAAVAGVLMGVFPAFEFWAALVMGIAVPEAVALAANQKRGPGLRAVALFSIAFGFILSRVVLSLDWYRLIPLGGINRPLGGGLPFLERVPFEINQYTILWFLLALFLAFQRLK